MNEDKILRQHLLQILNGRNAHLNFEDSVDAFPLEFINIKPPNTPYTPWHLIEHIRIAQWDILEFVRNPEHVSPQWPDEYWPDMDEKADQAGWDQSLADFRADMQAIVDMVNDPELDLLAEIPHAPGYTYLREILLVADHNAYHIGEFAILRQVMGTWHDH